MRQEIVKAMSQRVILLMGSDQRSRRTAVHEILVAGKCDDGMDSQVMSADEFPIREWVAAASTIPFLAERRVIVIRNLARLNPSKTWTDKISKDHPAVKELASVPESGLVLLVVDDESGDDTKQRAFGTSASAWQSIVKQVQGTVLRYDYPEGDTPKLIIEAVKKGGKKISRQAAVTLAEMVGGKVDAALDEIEKVLLYVGDNEEIHSSDIRALVTPTMQYNIWQLIDAVVAGNSPASVSQLRQMLGSKKDVAEEGLRSILPMIARQFRFVWQARGDHESGAQPSRSFPDLESLLPQQRPLNRERDWAQSRAMRQASRLSYDRILACMDAIVDADAKLKGQRPAFDAMDTLEQMVLQMSDICHQQNTTSAR